MGRSFRRRDLFCLFRLYVTPAVAPTSIHRHFAARLDWLVGPGSSTLLYGRGGWSIELQQRRRDDERRSRISDHGYQSRHWDGCFALVSSAPSRSACRSRRSMIFCRLATRACRRRSATSGRPLSRSQPEWTPVASTATDYSQDTHLFKVGSSYAGSTTGQPDDADVGAAPPQPLVGVTRW